MNMKAASLAAELGATSYPGRGIILGASGDGAQAVIAYFIMGRSGNSRNRVFVAEGEGLKTQAFDESKMEDPSLIIYSPVRKVGADVTVVTNGDQTDTVVDFLRDGGTFEQALRTREFEPDAPNYTPRISGMVVRDREGGGFRYALSILKSNGGDPRSCLRFFYEYAPVAGLGHFIHTYAGDGSPLPSFEGEPAPVVLEGDIDAFTDTVWNSLDADNKVSLFTRTIDLKTGAETTRIRNKQQGH